MDCADPDDQSSGEFADQITTSADTPCRYVVTKVLYFHWHANFEFGCARTDLGVECPLLAGRCRR